MTTSISPKLLEGATHFEYGWKSPGWWTFGLNDIPTIIIKFKDKEDFVIQYGTWYDIKDGFGVRTPEQRFYDDIKLLDDYFSGMWEAKK